MQVSCAQLKIESLQFLDANGYKTNTGLQCNPAIANGQRPGGRKKRMTGPNEEKAEPAADYQREANFMR